MKVKTLISLLKNLDDDLEIKYSSYSEGIQMDIRGVDIEKDYSYINGFQEDIAVIIE